MSERLRLQKEFSNQKPGLLKFAKTSRSNTTVLPQKGMKLRKFSSDQRAGKLQNIESGFCEDKEDCRKRQNQEKLRNYLSEC